MLILKKRVKHVVVPGKQHIIGVDGVEDVEAYNNYNEMSLFTDFTKKIGVVEKKPTQRHISMGTKRCQGGSCYGGGLTSLCKFMCL
jgi:type I site-specific restriction endonuclease